MNKNFKRFTLATYILLMAALVTTFTVGLGIVPGIVLTLALLLLDRATMGSNSTAIYAFVSLFTAPVFSLYTWIHDRLSPNLQKEQVYIDTNRDSFNTILSPKANLEPHNYSNLFSPKGSQNESPTQQDVSSENLTSTFRSGK
jgi:uncharacterized membrane protein YgaE (UPF0421/DUF939 family)